MAGLFLTIVQISSEFVGGQCASWRLPPKAAVSAHRRHSFVEGIRNGGLDFVKAAVRLSIGHGDCLLNDGFFFFCRRPADHSRFMKLGALQIHGKR